MNKIYAAVGLTVCFTVAGFLAWRSGEDNVAELARRGNLMWYNLPSAVMDDNAIYASWMTSRQEVVVSKVDQDEASATVVDTHRYLDDHGSPILHVPRVGPDCGRLRVIYCLHNSPIYTRLSAENHDITAWSEKTTISAGECTYPTLAESQRMLLLGYGCNESNSRPWCLRTSPDGGHTFGEECRLIQPQPAEWVYAMLASDTADEAIDLLFGIAQEEVVRNVFHVRSLDGGLTWVNASGTQLSLPIQPVAADQIFQTQRNRETRVWDIQRDRHGNLHSIWIDYDAQQALILWSQWNQQSKTWSVEQVASQGLIYYPAGGCILSHDPPTIALSVRENGGRHSIVEHIRESTGWRRGRTFSSIEDRSQLDAVRPTTVRGSHGLHLMWVDVRSYTSFQQFDTLVGATFLDRHVHK